ncbi:MAG: energy transducer TonB [Muribaculaceae bacterium]|nr:energy transducer TonB [Muribaculaceae bacterium]
MKKRNKGKKALTAVGAVVAAGLTPGFIAASAAGSSIQSPNAGATAAEVVAIDGKTYGFDELYAKQQINRRHKDTTQWPQRTLKYGVEMPDNIQIKIVNDGPPYRSVEQMPQFPGGEAALMKCVQSRINYPSEAAEDNIQGRVVVQFVIDSLGCVGEVKVVRSIREDLDAEAVRLVKSLPKFTPGRQNGQAVSVWYTLPITFKLPQ